MKKVLLMLAFVAIVLTSWADKTYYLTTSDGYFFSMPQNTTDKAVLSDNPFAVQFVQAGNAIYMATADGTYYLAYGSDNTWDLYSVEQISSAAAITLTAGTTVNLPLSATTAPPKPMNNGHEYVDLGLPSGLKWATCNVGASKPEEYGDYFAWGDTVPYYSSQDPLTWKEGKSAGYEWASYTWCKGSYATLTKYCSESTYGYNDFQDSKTTLDPEDDAARYQWGGSWRMPTKGDIDELLATKDNTTDYTWTWCDGSTIKYASTDVKGWQIVRNSTGATLFLPAAGYRRDASLDYVGSYGLYRSSSLVTDFPYNAYFLHFFSGYVNWYYDYRFDGLSVRPVCP